MEHLDPKEPGRLKHQMAEELDKLDHKPFVALRKMVNHRWGSLRMWPKWKSLRKAWARVEKNMRTNEDEDDTEAGGKLKHETLKEALNKFDWDKIVQDENEEDNNELG